MDIQQCYHCPELQVSLEPLPCSVTLLGFYPLILRQVQYFTGEVQKTLTVL